MAPASNDSLLELEEETETLGEGDTVADRVFLRLLHAMSVNRSVYKRWTRVMELGKLPKQAKFSVKDKARMKATVHELLQTPDYVRGWVKVLERLHGKYTEQKMAHMIMVAAGFEAWKALAYED